MLPRDDDLAAPAAIFHAIWTAAEADNSVIGECSGKLGFWCLCAIIGHSREIKP